MDFSNRNFSFNGSILGFDNLNVYSLSSIPNTAFYQLTSMEDPNIRFVLVHPFDWTHDYEIKLDEHCLETIKLSSSEHAIIMNIVTVNDPFISSTVNYRAPLILNMENGLATQFVIQDSQEYSCHAPLLINDDVKGGVSDASTD